MRIHQALVQASDITAFSFVPDQIRFGLVLARLHDARFSEQIASSMRLAKSFLSTLDQIAENRSTAPESSGVPGAILAETLRERLSRDDLSQWTQVFVTLSAVVDEVTLSTNVPDERIDAATRGLDDFAQFAKSIVARQTQAAEASALY